MEHEWMSVTKKHDSAYKTKPLQVCVCVCVCKRRGVSFVDRRNRKHNVEKR